MKWITRERVKVDRVACPWLIRSSSTNMLNFSLCPGYVADEAQRIGAIHSTSEREWDTTAKMFVRSDIKKIQSYRRRCTSMLGKSLMS